MLWHTSNTFSLGRSDDDKKPKFQCTPKIIRIVLTGLIAIYCLCGFQAGGAITAALIVLTIFGNEVSLTLLQ